MCATLAHRGPDGTGSFFDEAAGLAMRRLAIVDPTGGDQPMFNEDHSVAVIANAEIYNFRELREDLARRGHAFRTSCDTEVIAHLYEEHGAGFASRLRGMFAIAVWDMRERRLVLARDAFGIKPLYYAQSGGGLAFASELRGLPVGRDIDPDALEGYWARGFVPGARTIWAGASKLEPGHHLQWQQGRCEVTRFARPIPRQRGELRTESFAELAGELRDRLAESVRAHLLSDVPVGVLLSGGLDSSVITALAARESGEGLRTFSVGFRDAGFDERPQARQVAEQYGTDHHELLVEPADVDRLPTILGAFDEPFADPSAVPTYLVSELAAEHVKVVLTGEGGDELFGGYSTYIADQLAPIGGWLARGALPVLKRIPSSSSVYRLDDKARRFAQAAGLGAMERHVAWQEVFTRTQRATLVLDEHRGADPIDVYRRRWDETDGATGIARYQDLDLGVYLVDQLLTKTDRCSMAHGLEARVPLLDPAVAELALAAPSRHHVRGIATKRLLRAAAAPLLAPEIVDAPKRGFSLPTGGWLRGPLKGMVAERLSEAEVARQGVFDPVAVRQLVADHAGRRNDNSRQIWALLAFAVWHDAQR